MVKYLISLFTDWASGIPDKIITKEEEKWVEEDLQLRRYLKDNE